MRELIVYSRAGCHLCEFLIDELRLLCDGVGVGLRILDVDDDERLREGYGLRVPVVCADGAEISGWPLDRARIRAWLGHSQAAPPQGIGHPGE